MVLWIEGVMDGRQKYSALNPFPKTTFLGLSPAASPCLAWKGPTLSGIGLINAGLVRKCNEDPKHLPERCT